MPSPYERSRSNQRPRPNTSRTPYVPRDMPRENNFVSVQKLASLQRPLALEASQSIAAVYLAKPMLHPSVFRKRIDRIEGSPATGDYVAVYCTEGYETPHLFAYGIYNASSEITVRLVSWWSQLPDEAYWDQLLDQAVALRHETLHINTKTDAYRLIHAEADGFPGLAIDRYADVLSAEVFSAGMYQRAVQILEKLANRCGTNHYLVQTSPMFLSQEGFDASPIRSENLPKSVTTQEMGTKFRIHFETGHKTGFFCDQRDNRLKLAEWCRGKSVLDLCCYTGGFSIQAAKLGGAADVTGVDLDEEPLAFAKKNADLNQVRVKFAQSDAFSYMRDMLRLGRQYEIVVLDPPKLIRSRAEMEEGSKKHFDLNRLAMQLVKPGGLLLTCSCAGLLPSEDFFQMVRSAAKATGYDEDGKPRPPRTAQVICRNGAAEDHPFVTHCPETEYLKSMWLRLL